MIKNTHTKKPKYLFNTLLIVTPSGGHSPASFSFERHGQILILLRLLEWACRFWRASRRRWICSRSLSSRLSSGRCRKRGLRAYSSDGRSDGRLRGPGGCANQESGKGSNGGGRQTPPWFVLVKEGVQAPLGSSRSLSVCYIGSYQKKKESTIWSLLMWYLPKYRQEFFELFWSLKKINECGYSRAMD